VNVIRETALEFIARKDSVDVAKAMFDACYEGRYEEEQIYTALKNLADFNCKAIVIEGEDRKIQAAVLFFLAPDAFLIELVAHEHFLCVLPQWRHKRSHFKILLEALIGWSHEMGLRKLFVSSITHRSIPIPKPPVGGMPTSIACTKFSSIGGASSSTSRLNDCS